MMNGKTIVMGKETCIVIEKRSRKQIVDLVVTARDVNGIKRILNCQKEEKQENSYKGILYIQLIPQKLKYLSAHLLFLTQNLLSSSTTKISTANGTARKNSNKLNDAVCRN